MWPASWLATTRVYDSCSYVAMTYATSTAYAAAWLVVRLAGRSDQSDVVSTRFDSRIGSRTKSNMFDSSDRLSDRSNKAFTRYDRRTDQSDRPVGPTIVPCKRPVTVRSAVRSCGLFLETHFITTATRWDATAGRLPLRAVNVGFKNLFFLVFKIPKNPQKSEF